MKKIWFVLFLVSQSALAYIPNISGVLKEVFDNRKLNQPVEAVLRHRVNANGTTHEIEEKIFRDKNRTYVIWKTGGQSIAAVVESQGYALTKDRVIPSRSQAVIKYLLTENSDSYREQLLAERFLRRDQLLEFKAGFDPKGDPSTWGLKENYLRHDDIFMTRLDAGLPVIVVVGHNEGEARRAFFVDQKLQGIIRFEWKDGPQVATWNLVGESATSSLPKKLEFLVNGTDVATTDVLAVRSLKDKPANDLRNEWKQLASRAPSLSEDVENALKLLLSYR